MKVTRRNFIGGSAAIVAAGALTKPVHGAEKLRACIIGDTKQGEYGYSLHLVWGGREDVEVVGLADPDEEGRRTHAAQAKALRTYADYAEMLEKEKPDLVTIGPRWTTRHKEYLMAAVACGAHGLMEKPIASDLD